MALGQRKIAGEIIHHSDRGSQYARKDYQAMLDGAGITSRKRRHSTLGYLSPEEFERKAALGA